MEWLSSTDQGVHPSLWLEGRPVGRGCLLRRMQATGGEVHGESPQWRERALKEGWSNPPW